MAVPWGRNERDERNEAEAGDTPDSVLPAGGEARAQERTRDVGVRERVSAVLASAEKATEQLLAWARADADRIRAEAQNRAAETLRSATRDADRIRHEATQVRSQAVAQSDEMRASADAYAEEIRRRADADAAAKVAEAERRSRQERAEAVRGAKEIERAVLLRQQAVARDVRRAEERPSPQPQLRRFRSSLLWLLASTALGVTAAVVVFLDADTAYRAPTTLAFVVFCPGLALVRLLDIPGTVEQLALSVALSLALGVLVPAILLAAGAWSPTAAIGILVGITAAAAVFELFLARRRASAPAK